MTGRLHVFSGPMAMRRLALRWLVLLGLALPVAACGEDTDAPTAGERYTQMDADQIMTDPEHYITVDGVLRGVLRADTAFMYEDSALMRVKPVRLTIYNERGTVAGVVTSRTGVLNMRTNSMTATGDVVVVSEERGQRIETEEMHFDPNRDRVWSDTPTTLHRDGTVLHGSGFTSNSRLTDTRLNRPEGRVEGLEFDL